MGSFRDLSGQRFGTFTALFDSGKRHNGSVLWLCTCDCGNQLTISQKRLQSGAFAPCPICSGRSVIDSYAVGILWATSCVHEHGMIVRNIDPFFAQFMASLCGGTVFTLNDPSRGLVFHCVKIPPRYTQHVSALGFSGRTDADRVFPAVEDPFAFACAYVQCHSTLDVVMRNSRSGRQYAAPRLRINGSLPLVSGINSVFHDTLSCGLKTPQRSGGTHTLYYQKAAEVIDICEAVASYPNCSPTFQRKVDVFLRSYRKS